MTAVTAEQTAADLLSAANHIETYGWRQRQFGSVGKPCCVDGAITVAVSNGEASGLPTEGDQTARSMAACEALTKVIGQRIWGWNDAPDRTQEHVVAALRAAAEQVMGR